MEDSYTAHRRRKAAAKKREKTPEPPKRRQDDVGMSPETDADADEEEEDDDDDRVAETRARMERMVRETEMLEESEATASRKRFESDKLLDDKPPGQRRALKRATSPPSPTIRRRDEQPRENVEIRCRKQSRSSSGSTRISEKEESGKSPVRQRTKTSTTTGNIRDGRVVEHRLEVETRRVSSERGPRAQTADVETSAISHPENGTVRRVDDSTSFKGKTWSERAEEIERAAISDENRYEEAGETNTGADASASTSPSGTNLIKVSAEIRDVGGGGDGGGDDEEKRHREEMAVDDEASSRDLTALSRKIPSAKASRSSKRSNESPGNNEMRAGYTRDSSETADIGERYSGGGEKCAVTIEKRVSKSRARQSTDTADAEAEVTLEKEEDDGGGGRRRNEKRSIDRRSRLMPRDNKTKEHTRGKDDRPAAIRRGPSDREKRANERESSLTTERRALAFEEGSPLPPPPPLTKKQIIPLSDDSLVEDYERARLDRSSREERSILDRDPLDDYVDPKMVAALRRRKFNVIRTDETPVEFQDPIVPEKKSRWLTLLPSFFSFFGINDRFKQQQKRKPEKEEKDDKPGNELQEATPRRDIEKEKTKTTERWSILEYFRTLGDFADEFRDFVRENPWETRQIVASKNRCTAGLLLVVIYCGLGAFVFRFTEGAFETFYKCGVKRVKRDFLDSLWILSHNMREDEWKSMARRKLMELEEQLHAAHEAGVRSYSGQKSWTFPNAVVYCLTVITTIGYGHISPSTTTGRAITIVYAIFGIPMFLIILADFGKLFTRGIKFLWAFVRRVYYTGSCRRVRRTVPVQEVMKGVQLVYDLATFRRPSQMNPEEIQEMEKQQNASAQHRTILNLDGNSAPSPGHPDTPGTPAMSTFAIDDEFNLPISVAIVILLAYIFVGATVYNFWEQWGFFESFYFVFISMSTIGFGDYVPKHPIYMMLSIVYLVFGLALTSMCINVVQVMLSDSFRQASQKIGATIGFQVTEEDGSAALPPMDITDAVRETHEESESEDRTIAPTAKQEDTRL